MLVVGCWAFDSLRCLPIQSSEEPFKGTIFTHRFCGRPHKRISPISELSSHHHLPRAPIRSRPGSGSRRVRRRLRRKGTPGTKLWDPRSSQVLDPGQVQGHQDNHSGPAASLTETIDARNRKQHVSPTRSSRETPPHSQPPIPLVLSLSIN